MIRGGHEAAALCYKSGFLTSQKCWMASCSGCASERSPKSTKLKNTESWWWMMESFVSDVKYDRSAEQWQNWWKMILGRFNKFQFLLTSFRMIPHPPSWFGNIRFDTFWVHSLLPSCRILWQLRTCCKTAKDVAWAWTQVHLCSLVASPPSCSFIYEYRMTTWGLF